MNFEHLGYWWFEEEGKSVVKVDGIPYILDGWTGKTYQFSREVLDYENKIVSHTLYKITPEYIDLNDDLENQDIVGYEVSLY